MTPPKAEPFSTIFFTLSLLSTNSNLHSVPTLSIFSTIESAISSVAPPSGIYIATTDFFISAELLSIAEMPTKDTIPIAKTRISAPIKILGKRYNDLFNSINKYRKNIFILIL